MRRFALCLLLTLVAAPAGAQDGASPNERAVTIGERFTLQSAVLGEERRYWVHLPASYENARYAPQRYPVLYILDGDAHFHSATGVIQFMSAGINGNIQIPEMIVVAIPNTDRTRDLTPTHTRVGYDGKDAAFLETSGGADAFLRFIRDELMPHIDRTYRTRPYRVLVGHSFGGLLALHALLEQPDMFQSYIAIDPSLWWDDRVLVRRADGRLAGAGARHGAVYITLANNPPIRGVDPSVMTDPGNAFARSLQAVSTPTFRSALRYFDAEDHGSVPLVSLYHGLLHVFDGYKPPGAAMFERPSSLADHFARVSERLGLELLPPEAIVNQLGYAFLHQLDEPDKSIELFRLNVANYPASANAHDSLGEAYMAKGEKDLAIASYERSLQLDPSNDNAKEKLRELRGGGPR